MNSQHGRITVLTATLLALAALPATARAGSLLSGYGGPGQGNQAILGAALIGGPSGGGGSGTAASGGSSLAAASGDEAGSGALAAAASGKPGAPRRAHSGATRHAGRTAAAAPAAAPPATTTLQVSADSPALGISETDLLFILLGLGGLLAAGALTRHLSRHPR